MSTSQPIVRRFKAKIDARRYANSKGHIRTVSGAIDYEAYVRPQDIIQDVCQIVSGQCTDLHSIGRVTITLLNDSRS